jgi:hypothetical protein
MNFKRKNLRQGLVLREIWILDWKRLLDIASRIPKGGLGLGKQMRDEEDFIFNNK